MKNYKRKKKLNTGGDIGNAIGVASSTFLPGSAPVLGAAGRIFGSTVGRAFSSDPRDPKKITTATRGYKHGGKYKRHFKYPMGGHLPTAGEAPIGPDAVRYDGPRHEEGGIPIDGQGHPTSPDRAEAEVEGGETRQGDFIFSDELTVPGEDMTFAEAHEILLAEGAGEEEIQQLAMLQEQVKQEQGIESDLDHVGGDGTRWGEQGFMTLRKGGKMKKYQTGGMQPDMSRIPRAEETEVPMTAGVSRKSPVSMETAQRMLPSVTRLASAAFAPRPEKIEPRTLEVSDLPTTSPAFAEGRRQMAAGFRGASARGNHQGALAQYTAGVNQLAAQEADFGARREESNRATRMQADQFNIQGEHMAAREHDQAVRQDIARRIELIDEAIQAPLTAGVADRRGREQMIATIATAAGQIENPRDRANFLDLVMSLMEGGDSAEEAIKKARQGN